MSIYINTYLHTLVDHILGPADLLLGDGVSALEVSQVKPCSDLTELVVLFQQLGDFLLVGGLVDLVSAVKFLHIVHHPQNHVNLLFILQFGPLAAAQPNAIFQHPTKYNINLSSNDSIYNINKRALQSLSAQTDPCALEETCRASGLSWHSLCATMPPVVEPSGSGQVVSVVA